MLQSTQEKVAQVLRAQKVAAYRNAGQDTTKNPTEHPDRVVPCCLQCSPAETQQPYQHMSVQDCSFQGHKPVNQADVKFPAVTAGDCPPPVDSWAGLARKTGIRPAVDKHTIARYSPAEWRLRNEEITGDTHKAIRAAKDKIFAVDLVADQVYAPVDLHQQENRSRLQHRACTVYAWKSTLEHASQEVTQEIQEVQQIIPRILRCIRAVKIVGNIDADLLKARKMRLGPDLVHDHLTEEIVMEEALCREIIDLYERCIGDVKMLTQELKDAKGRLEGNWSDKQEAYDIDVACLRLNMSSSTLQWKPGVVTFPEKQSLVTGYEYATKETIIFVHAALARSRIFRANIKDIIKQAVKDLQSRATSVEAALDAKILESAQTCRDLERTLSQCLKSLAATETVFSRINSAIGKLDGPMKCAQTRLDLRSKRRNDENCRDAPHFGLIDEVKVIADSVTRLTSNIKGAENSIEDLTKSRSKIEKEILIKRRTLWVDSERCRSIRSCYPSNETLFGYK